ncbi:hypothetical protein Tco_0367535 [Tanacetum coccineum]
MFHHTLTHMCLIHTLTRITPNTGSQSFEGNHYGAHGDNYYAVSLVPSSSYEIEGSSAGFHRDGFDPIVHSEDCVESSIVPSSSYEIEGSSAGFHRDDFDPIVHSEDCVESDDDEMRD